MKKKSLAILLTMVLAAGTLAGCGNAAADSSKEAESASASSAAEEASVAEEGEDTSAPAEEASSASETEDKGTLMMATTTSTEDTGLLDYLAPLFKEATGYTLEWTAVGTGEALKMGENGDVDVVLVHAKASEEEFVANGFGVERVPVMYNDFVVVGPAEPIQKSDDIGTVFKEITDQQLAFINRGDDSGTDKKEKKIWDALGIDPTTNPNYVESGQGMGATLTMADEQQAYCLSDRGTYLKQKKDASVGLSLEIVCEGSSDLLNQYGVIAVNPEKFPDTNIDGANAFIEWICSADVQKLIGEYGVEDYGQALFTPNAGTDN